MAALIAFGFGLTSMAMGSSMTGTAAVPVSPALQKLYRWTEVVQSELTKDGEKLDQSFWSQAAKLGIVHPEKIRIAFVKEIPHPDNTLLPYMPESQSGWQGDTLGLTLGYVVCLREDQRSNQALLVHELVHVAQHERMGGFGNFFNQYMKDLMSFGYWNTPLEKEAYAKEEEFQKSLRPT